MADPLSSYTYGGQGTTAPPTNLAPGAHVGGLPSNSGSATFTPTVPGVGSIGLPADIHGSSGTVPSGPYAGTPSWLGSNLSEQNPLPWQVYLPNETTNIGMTKASQGMSPDFYNSELSQNVAKPGTAIGGAPGMMNDPGMNNPMTAAIQAKAQGQFNNQLQGIQNQKNQQVPLAMSQSLATASDVFGKQYQIELNNFKEQYSFQQQRQQAFNAWQNGQNAATASYVGAAIGGAITIGAAAFA